MPTDTPLPPPAAMSTLVTRRPVSPALRLRPPSTPWKAAAQPRPAPPTAPARAVLVDPHAVVTDALRTVLAPPTAEVVAVARSAAEARRAVAAAEPDLVVVETAVPGCGSAFVAALRAADAEVCLVALTACDDPAACVALLEAGLDGFVLKRTRLERFRYAVDRALGGALYLDDGLPPAALALALVGPRPDPPDAVEAEVFALLGDGLAEDQIAEALALTEAEVRERCESLRDRLGVASPALLVRAAVLDRAGIQHR